MRSSGIFSFERIKCRTITPSVHGGGLVRIRVSRELLDPTGKDIAGLLHINGTKVFIPQDRQITIGSAKGCDIRIIDKLIEGHQILLTHQANGFEINNLSEARKLAVRKEGSKEIDLLDKGVFGTLELTVSARIYLELSGIGANSQKRLLELRLEIPQLEVTSAVQKLLEPKLDVEEVAPEQALVRVAAQNLPHELIKINPEIIAKTTFSDAACLEDVLDIFEAKNAEYAKEERLYVKGGAISGGISIAGIISAGIIGVMSPPLFLAMVLAGGGFTEMLVFGTFKIKNEKAWERLDEHLASILIKMKPEDVARVLTGREQATISKVLDLLNKKNQRIAKEVRAYLGLQMQANQPPQLEPPKA